MVSINQTVYYRMRIETKKGFKSMIMAFNVFEIGQMIKAVNRNTGRVITFHESAIGQIVFLNKKRSQ